MTHSFKGSRAWLVGAIFAFAIIGALSGGAIAHAGFGDGAPTVSNPSVFTLQDSKAKVDGTSGAFTQHITLDIPPGRNGVQPDISLDYSSQRGEDGIVGYGWSLSIPYVERLNKTGSEDLYGPNPYFISSIDGELATTSTSSSTFFRARIDDGSFRSYSFENNTWTVYDKSGTRYLYGSTNQSRMGTTTSQSYRWMLEEIRDTNDNYVEFTYLKDENEIYPYQITYTGNGSTDGPASVTFATSTRPDVIYSYKPGFKVTTSYRISQIKAYFNGTLVRQYDLSYTTGANGYRSLLSSVQQTGWDESSNQLTLPPISFSYYADTTTLFYTPSSSTVPVDGQSYVVSDTNGNAINDVNKFYFNQSSNATGSVIFIDQSTSVTNVVPDDYWTLTPDPATPQERGVRYLDVNGDGMADLPRGMWDNTTSTTTQKLYINAYATSTGYAWTLASTTPAPFASFSDPTAYWKLDESSGVAADSTGSGHSLTNNNSISYATGKINNGATLASASSQYFSRSDHTDFDASTGFSFCTWIKLTALPGSSYTTLISKQGDSNESYGIFFSVLANNDVYVRWGDNGTYVAPHQAAYYSGAGAYWVAGDVGTWRHFCVTADAVNGVVKVYKDGSATTLTQDSTVTSIYNGSAPFYIGRYSQTDNIRHLNAAIDEAAFFKNYVLSSQEVNTLYNGGAGQSYPYATTTPIQSGIVPTFLWHGASSPQNITTGVLGDVNGDKFPDFVLALDTPLDGIPANSTYLGNGSAWDAGVTSLFTAPSKVPAATTTITNNMLIDINGDKLDDWVYSTTTGTVGTHVLLNTGVGWESSPDSHWFIATTTLLQISSTTPVYDRGMRFMDINGDGLTDFVRAYNVTTSGTCSSEATTTKYVLLNTGSGWATSTTHTLSSYITTATSSTASCGYNEYANWNGNGQMKQDVISTVTYPKGGSTSVSYGLTAQLGSNTQLPYSLLVVTSLVNSDNRGGSETTSYSYGGALQYTAGAARDQKFAGFATTTETRSDRITQTYYNQGNGILYSAGEQSDGFAHINHPYREDIFTPDSVLLKRTYSKWSAVEHGASTFIGLVRKLVQSFAPDGSHRDSATEYIYSSTNDDLTEIDEYGEVTGSSDGTFTDVSGDSRSTLITHAASSSVNMSVPIEKRVLSNGSATSTVSKLYYDTLAYGSVGKGNQTKEESWITSSTYASSTKTYNSYGLVTQQTDRNGNATTFSYDSFNLYVATATNALSQSATSTYNYTVGKAKQTTDPNGRLMRNTYDAVGRLKLVEQSDTADPASYVTKTQFGFYDSTTTLSFVHETNYLNSATSTQTYSYYDGLGRLVQERKSTESAASSSVSDLVYDSAGQLYKKSLPYFSAGASSTSATLNNALYTYFWYDPLGRVGTTSSAVGTTTTAYGGWTATTTDALGHFKDYSTDAYGNLTQVREYLSSAARATTTYEYDAANSLTKITDALSNVRNFTYDGLGRRLTAEDLHAVGDAAFGTWTYTYDHAGNLTSQTDPKSQEVNKTYDALNRLLTEDYTGGSGTEVVNTYDSCRYGIGSLCTASSTSSLTSNAYDILGRVSIATTSIVNASSSVMSYMYDRQGNITDLVYPSGSRVAYTFNTAGLTETVSHATSSGAFSFVVSNFDYGPTNLPTLKTFGSGAYTAYTYDASALYRLTRIATVGTSSPLADIASHVTGYWKLNESSGAASDSSGAGLTLTNNNTITYGSGKIDNAATLAAASSQYYSRSDESAFDASTGFSFCTWIKLTALPGANYETLISKMSDPSNNSYSINFSVLSNNDVYVRWSSTGSTFDAQYYSATGYWVAGDVGTWRHLCVTADATNGVVKVYKDGSATTLTQSSNATSVYNGTAPFYIGRFSQTDAIRYLDASLDESTFFKNYVLSGDEVSQLYNSGSGQELTFGGSSSEMLQDLNYTYDAIGNISTLQDVGSSTARRIVTYTYDWLNRLTNANGSIASSSPYTYAYTYDSLGSILTGGALSSTSTSVTSPQSYWKYDETSGAAADSSGNSHTLTNNNTITYAAGQLNNAATLATTSSQYFTHTDHTDFDPSTSFSFCTWLKLTYLPDSSYETLISKLGNGTSDAYLVGLGAQSANDVYVGWTSGGAFTAGNRANYTTSSGYWVSGDVGTWRHFCITADAANGVVKAYKDGSATTLTQNETVTSIHNGTSSFLIGKFSDSDNIRHLGASIDEARFWKNTVLTQADVDSLYAGESNAHAENTYAYAGTNYANPHAVTSIGNGAATSTFAYDFNGNLASTTGATSTVYTWDYANRLLQSVSATNATSTYGYSTGVDRVFQVTPTATTTYPNRWFSRISSLAGATTTATTTEYIFAGDTLLATVDSEIVGGTASGTPMTRFMHPDHLGSTNIVSNGALKTIQALDYFPYGAQRISWGSNATDRQYIGERFDETSQLNYLNARMYDASRGQFLSQDKIFWSKNMSLKIPQSLNAYLYSNGNPVVRKDTQGDASYYFANGAGLTGTDTWNNGTYYEGADYSMLVGDAVRAQSLAPTSNVMGLAEFVRLNLGEWNFKATANANEGGRKFYFFNGQLVNAETYGNYHYGYVGTAAGFSPFALYAGAGAVQVWSSFPSLSGSIWTYFDNPDDPAKIQYGIGHYLSANRLWTTPSGAVVNSEGKLLSAQPGSNGSGGGGGGLVTTPSGAIVDPSTGTLVQPPPPNWSDKK